MEFSGWSLYMTRWMILMTCHAARVAEIRSPTSQHDRSSNSLRSRISCICISSLPVEGPLRRRFLEQFVLSVATATIADLAFSSVVDSSCINLPSFANVLERIQLYLFPVRHVSTARRGTPLF